MEEDDIFWKRTLPAGAPSIFSILRDSFKVILSPDFGGIVTSDSPIRKTTGEVALLGKLTRIVCLPAELNPKLTLHDCPSN
jgi:hypothetical protein